MARIDDWHDEDIADEIAICINEPLDDDIRAKARRDGKITVWWDEPYRTGGSRERVFGIEVRDHKIRWNKPYSGAQERIQPVIDDLYDWLHS